MNEPTEKPRLPKLVQEKITIFLTELDVYRRQWIITAGLNTIFFFLLLTIGYFMLIKLEVWAFEISPPLTLITAMSVYYKIRILRSRARWLKQTAQDLLALCDPEDDQNLYELFRVVSKWTA
ncbi:MAG: hypothetical protein NUV53_02290 [Patescibacteria group bacterium]|nr:hypothetical protein [Patescibacteria group bacterium]